MQVTLLTNNSPRSYELMAALDEVEIEYELKPTQRTDAPILIVNDREYRFTQALINRALKFIRKRVKEHGDIIFD